MGGNTGTTLCGSPDDKWGWAVLAGAEIKLDMLSPGSRVGFYGTYGVGATGLTRNSQISAGLFGSGNELAFGILSDAVYGDGTQMELTTAWAVGGGFEYFWTRNFSSTVYGGYTRTEYNANAAALICTRLDFSGSCSPNFSVWGIGTHHDWFPLPGLRFAVDAMYTGVDTAFSGQTIAVGGGATGLRSIGARPTGDYLAKDLGIWTVAFRAQRTWGGGD